MLLKHPQVAPLNLPPGPVPPPLSLIESAVLKAVKSFPNGSARGPSGFRPSYLKEAVGCPSPDHANRLLTSLTRLVNFLAAGCAPPSITPHLCGASLLACRKKNGVIDQLLLGKFYAG